MAVQEYHLTQTGQETQDAINRIINLDVATQEADGLMSAGDKEKLDGINPSDLATQTDLASKVDKVQGKGLSANDYTDEEKAKLGNLPSGPELFVAVYGTTAFSDVLAAYNAGKTVVMKDGETILFATYIDENVATFSGIGDDKTCYFAVLSEIGWEEIYTYPIPEALSQLSDSPNYRLVTDTEKGTWNGKYSKPPTGIPAVDLASGVIPDVSGKADKVSGGTENNFAALDANGNMKDSGHKHSDYLTSHQDISGKADKVSSPTAGNFAGLDENGNITDSGKKASDFATAAQGAKADTAYQKPANGIPDSDLASGVIPDVSNFITKSVDDLVNYYLKSETYTKTEVQNLIGAINQFHYEIYASTSAVTSPANNVLYLIGPTGTGSDKYEEYVYDSTKQDPWVKIGDTSIDLSGYVTTSTLNTALADYTTTANLTTLLAGKQDKIDSTHKLDYSLVDNTPTIPDAVEANPTVPAGTTPTALTGLKIGSSYYSAPNPTALSNNDIDTIWTNAMS